MMGRNRTADKPGADKTTLSDFAPQRQNANRHTERGMGLLEKSIRTDGYSTPMVAAADGEIFDGSARIEKVGELMAEAEPIVVHSDGTRPVIHVRDDIPSASDPRAVRLAIAANRIAQVNLDWDIPLLMELPEITGELWSPEELGRLTSQFDVGEADAPGLPAGDRAAFQQMTFTLHDDQAEQVKAAIEKARGMGPFVGTGNENSNGNALARVCEVFLGAS